jgi:hypothetical protein
VPPSPPRPAETDRRSRSLRVVREQGVWPVVHRKAVPSFPQLQVRSTALRVDHENSLTRLSRRGCEDGAEALLTSAICQTPTCLQVCFSISGQCVQLRLIASADLWIGQIENRTHSHLDRNQVARLLQTISDEVLPVLGKGPCLGERCVEAAILALAVPPSRGFENETKMKGMGALRHMPPDEPGKVQMKAPDSKAARMPMIFRILPLRICAMGVCPRRLGRCVVSQRWAES